MRGTLARLFASDLDKRCPWGAFFDIARVAAGAGIWPRVLFVRGGVVFRNALGASSSDPYLRNSASAAWTSRASAATLADFRNFMAMPIAGPGPAAPRICAATGASNSRS